MGGTATQAPETGVYSTPPNRIWQATYVSTLSSKALFEFGYSAYNNRWGGPSAPGNPTPDLIQVREQGGAIPGLCYRAGSPAVRRHVPQLDRLDFGEHVAREHLVRHRLAQHQGRLQRPVRLRQPGLELRQLAGAGLPVQQRRAEPDLGALGRVQEPVAYSLRRLLRAGSVDAQQADAAGRGAVRACLQLLPGVVHRGHALLPDVHDDSRGGRRELQGHHAARRRRVRRLRQRQDVAEGELGQVRAAGAERGHLHRRRADVAHRHHRDAELDRRQPQLRRGLQPDDARRLRCHGRRRRPLRRAVEHQLRHAQPRVRVQPAAADRPASLGLSAGPRRAAAADLARVHGSAVEQALVQRLLREPQQGGAGVGLERLQHHGAGRFAAPRRRRIRRHRSPRHHAVEVRPVELRSAGDIQLRRPVFGTGAAWT